MEKKNSRDFDDGPERLVTSGCLMAIGSAAFTGLLLFVNGSLVLAVLSMMSNNDVPFVGKPQVSQFLLFSMPIGMVIIQWLMFDYVRERLSSRG